MTPAKLAEAAMPEFWRHPSGALVAPGDRWRGKANDRDVRVQSIWVDTTPASTRPRIRIAVRSVTSNRLSYIDANAFVYRFELVERPGAIEPAAAERDAMAAANGRLTTELSACREAFNLETAMRTNATDENVRLTAELAEAGAARDHFRDELAEAKAENGRLRDTNARLVALLEPLLWNGRDSDRPYCLCCGIFKGDTHLKTCDGGALLAEIEAGA